MRALTEKKPKTIKSFVEYTITGKTKDPSNPKRFLTLGMRGRPQLEKRGNGDWFLITGCIRDEVFENVKDLRILQESLRDAITKCDCHLVTVRVSLTVEE